MNISKRNRKILVVEDERFMRTLLVQSLHSLGYSQVREAKNAETALARLEHWNVDLIITDVEMGELSGLDMIRVIRNGTTPLADETPIIVVTGLSELSVLKEAVDLNVQGFLTKPTSQRLLQEKVERALTNSDSLNLHHSRPIPAKKGHNHSTSHVVARQKPIGGTETGRRPTPSVGKGTPAQGAECAQEGSVLPLEKLAVGMVVLSDLTAKGSILVQAGTQLQAAHLLVLRDMRNLLDQEQVAVE
jgi:two-component system chemotaxis response regulator CheY